eukprot:scaffold44925_cov78-Cyclotella_meneghiniana.AAC.6
MGQRDSNFPVPTCLFTCNSSLKSLQGNQYTVVSDVSYAYLFYISLLSLNLALALALTEDKLGNTY